MRNNYYVFTEKELKQLDKISNKIFLLEVDSEGMYILKPYKEMMDALDYFEETKQLIERIEFVHSVKGVFITHGETQYYMFSLGKE